MKAFILAAGLGTRLGPLTSNTPKALVAYQGKTLLELAIMKLASEGIQSFVINVHHFAEQILSFLDKNNNFGLEIVISDESDKLLDTGGAILKAQDILNSTSNFLIYNVDVLTNFPISNLIKQHTETNALATLAVQRRETSRYLLFDESMLLRGWMNTFTNEKITDINSPFFRKYAFSGIHILNNRIFDMIEEKGKFSIINMYLRMRNSDKILGYDISDYQWRDMGKPEAFLS